MQLTVFNKTIPHYPTKHAIYPPSLPEVVTQYHLCFIQSVRDQNNPSSLPPIVGLVFQRQALVEQRDLSNRIVILLWKEKQEKRILFRMKNKG